MAFGFMFYYLNIICLVIYRCIFSGKKGKKAFLFIVCFHLFIILAIRSTETGVDSRDQYPSVFNAVNQLSFSELISRWSLIKQMRLSPYTGYVAESGYATLNWICGSFLGLSYRALLVFLSFLNALAVYKYLRRNSASPLLGAMAMYVVLMSMFFSGLRRATAMSIFMFALLEAEEKNYKKAWILMFLAFIMHRSSLIMCIFPLLSRIKITRELVFKIIVLTCVLGLFAKLLATNLIARLLIFFDKGFYLQSGSFDMTRGYTKTISYVYTIMCILALVGIYFFVDFKIFSTPENNMLLWIFLFFVAFSPVDMVMPIITQEISKYFRPSMFLLFANIITQRKENPYVKAFMWFMMFSALVFVQNWYVHTYFNEPIGYMMEYKTMFQTLSGQ